VPPGADRPGDLLLVVVAADGFDAAATDRELIALRAIPAVASRLVSGTAFRAGPGGLTPWHPGDGDKFPRAADGLGPAVADAAALAAQAARPDRVTLVLVWDSLVSPAGPAPAADLVPRVVWLNAPTNEEISPTLQELTRDPAVGFAGNGVTRPPVRAAWPQALADSLQFAGWGAASARPAGRSRP
jgi:hypothetical protein